MDRVMNKMILSISPEEGGDEGPPGGSSSGDSEGVAEITSSPVEKSRSDLLGLIPENIRAHSSLDGINSVGDLAKSYISAQSMIGKNKVAIPGENATDADKSEFYTAIGRPSTSIDYGLIKAEDWPEDLPFHDDVKEAFQDKAYNLGLSKDQASGIFDWYTSLESDNFNSLTEQATNELNESIETLKTRFGNAFDERVDLANRAINQYGNDDLTAWMEETGLGNHPKMVELFSNIGNAMKEDGLLEGIGGGDKFTMTPDEALSEMENLHIDKEFMDAYINANNTGHASAVKKMTALNQMAYPSTEPLHVIGGTANVE